jgi:hypothetical protein
LALIFQKHRLLRPMRIWNWLFLAVICFGIWLWHKAAIVDSGERWEPVTTVVPNPGQASIVPFALPAPGRYAVQIWAPDAPGAAKPEESIRSKQFSPVRYDLEIAISGPHGNHSVQRTDAFGHVSDYAAGHIFQAGLRFDLPESGRYECTVTAAPNQTSPWSPAGAQLIVALDQVNPTDAMVRGPIGRCAAVILIGLGLVGFFYRRSARPWVKREAGR